MNLHMSNFGDAAFSGPSFLIFYMKFVVFISEPNMSTIESIMPNTEKLFMYVQKGSWHNVTPSSTGFVKKEYFQHLAELEADEREYKSLRLMIEHAEMGRYTEAKNLFNDAHTQFQNMVSLVMEKRKVIFLRWCC